MTHENDTDLEIVGRVSYIRARKVKPKLSSPPQYRQSPYITWDESYTLPKFCALHSLTQHEVNGQRNYTETLHIPL